VDIVAVNPALFDESFAAHVVGLPARRIRVESL